MKKVDYLLIYEHKNRELDNLCLLRAELERRGYVVDIFYRFDHIKRFKLLLGPKPKVVGCIAAYGTETLFHQVYKYTGPVNKIINFRWEQLFGENGNDTFKPTGDVKNIAHLCWGKKPFDQLNEAGVVKTAITGPLQMDFLIPPMNKVYLSGEQIKKQFNIPLKSKVLLYISSFAYLTMSETELSFYENWLGMSLQSAVETEKKTFKTTIDCLNKLLEEDESLYVVYRPHPVEKIDTIKGMELSNRFIINSDYSIKQWILASDYIITWISTSICEVYFAHKSAVVFRPFPVPSFHDPVVYKNCKFARNFNEVKQQLSETESFPIDEEIVKGYYDVNEDKPSYLRTADFFEEVLKDDKYNFVSNKTYYFKTYKNAISSLCIYFIAKNKFFSKIICIWPFSRLKTAYDEYLHYSTDAMQEKEINSKVALYKKILEENKA